LVAAGDHQHHETNAWVFFLGWLDHATNEEWQKREEREN